VERGASKRPREAAFCFAMVEVAGVFAPSLGLTLAAAPLGPPSFHSGVPARSRRAWSNRATRVRLSQLRFTIKQKGPQGPLLFDWWRWRESNPRPQALRLRFYMRSLSFI